MERTCSLTRCVSPDHRVELGPIAVLEPRWGGGAAWGGPLVIAGGVLGVGQRRGLRARPGAWAGG